jgi:hypothetical protein
MGTVAETFMDALIARDFDRLAGCLSPDAQARLLLPRGAEEILGRGPIRARIEGWFSTASEFDLLYSSLDSVGARQRLNWRFHVVRDGQTAETIEQVLFVDGGPEGLQRLDLLCSGFHPMDAPSSCAVGASPVSVAEVVTPAG